jgi:hypothetical protein
MSLPLEIGRTLSLLSRMRQSEHAPRGLCTGMCTSLANLTPGGSDVLGMRNIMERKKGHTLAC